MADYTEELAELARIQDRLRTLRDRVWEPKNNQNPRYLGLSSAVSGINKAMDDMRTEARSWLAGGWPRPQESLRPDSQPKCSAVAGVNGGRSPSRSITK